MDSTSSGSGSFKIGNGLVEIGALTTLIGSTIAESLVLGNGGSSGLVWGTISAFGSPSVIRACISGASPGWLRAMLGLRSASSDAAVGLQSEFSLYSEAARKVRINLDFPLGISLHSEDGFNMDETLDLVSSTKEHHLCRDIYAFDRPTSRMLDGLPATSPGDPLTVYTNGPYPFFNPHDTRLQVSALALSLIKFSEVYILSTHGGALLALASAVSFIFFFSAATFIEIRDISLSRRAMDEDGRVDLVAGTLPTIKRLGGQKKVVLGATKNPRTSVWWRLIWAFGALLHTISLLTTYFLLGQQTTSLVLIWAGFQLAWLILRIVLYYLSDITVADRIMVGHQWNALQPSMKARVAGLTLAVAKYQTHVHGRDFELYIGDCFSFRQIARLLAEPNLRTSYELPSKFTRANLSVQVNIVAIIGDTTLSSAAWMMGSELSAMELYDSCIVVFSLPSESPPSPPAGSPLAHSPSRSHQRTVAIPAVRVAVGITPETDAEKRAPLFVPRASQSHTRGDIDVLWYYWIPCRSGVWLQIKSDSKRSTVLGEQVATVLDHGQLSTLLGAGKLRISLKDAEEVREVAKLSQQAAEYLLSLLH
ncbi:hypothetical protein BDZ97DRAFT_917807 [Flammula alnicola]|nr:hypothetical protein BDZ97DRAFT_917807 [Flammula alnicola]